ncbi:MAG: 2-C-methyl-D-erythritol 2,4-cyclodiphosphate synthase [Spirochaetes bacterium]|nr:2-C-methyl-D-erythritol 2,4-cyclodiphosphate synthase [Spirochaetota bacterium]
MKKIPLPDLPLGGRVFLLLAAGGTSARFGGGKKEFFDLGGKSVLLRALEPFLGLAGLAGIAVVYPAGMLEETAEALGGKTIEKLESSLGKGIRLVEGGKTRQASVAGGLAVLASMSDVEGSGNGDLVLVHDAARPWVSPALAEAVLASTRRYGASIPLCELPDTPKEVGNAGFIASHPERSSMKAAQTPQGFALAPLLAAHAAAAAEVWSCTDDSSLWERYVGKVAYVEGERKNRKLTYRDDLEAEAPNAQESLEFRIGEGWDIHPLVEGRPLLLGGVRLEYTKGEAGYSDGDVLWHAIIDAILGAAGLGDIGGHFPSGDPRWKNADSSLLAAEAAKLLRRRGWIISNLDSTVILEAPRLGPCSEAIRLKIAFVLNLDPDRVSVKAKTFEGFGEVGRGEAVEARAVALIERVGRGLRFPS